MTAPVNSTPLSIDYTSRDYYSLRTDLIQRVKDRVPDWTGNDPADFGVALIEAFAYVGDIVNYYIDRVANESYIGTATQRQSILNIANTYGYYPTGYRAADLDVSFTNTGADDITIPAGTQLTATIVQNDTVQQVLFTTTEEATVLAGDSTVVTATQSEDVSKRPENADVLQPGELFISDGTPEQQFTLSENQVVDGTVKVYVKNGNSFFLWENVLHITDFGPLDNVYTTTTDSSNYVCVNFGDGVSGYIPPKDSVIRVVYMTGGGTVGNIPAQTPLDIHQVFGVTSEQLTSIVTNIVASSSAQGVGGAEPESNDEIRKNAPLVLTALNRAVTLKDFANVSLAVQNVGKANAEAAVWNSVTVYVAPQQNASQADTYPGYNSVGPNVEANLTPSFEAMRSRVHAFVVERAQIGTTVTVSPPTYIPVSLAVQYTKDVAFQQSVVEANLRSAMASIYSYANTSFAQVVTPEEIEGKLRLVSGVTTVKVQYMYRHGESPTREILVGTPGEIFTFEDRYLSLALLSSDATLSGLAVSSGALSPTFSSSFYNYNVTTSTNPTTLTPTVTSGATIYVDGALVASGTGADITTPTGQTTALVTVIAPDGITAQAYRVTFTK